MSQETTKEFSARLRMAVEGHPLAPDTPFGRQSWLREKLAREAKIEVSANAIHKWMNDASRPREDNIRAIAKVLNVDELWLSMGKTPGNKSDTQGPDPGKATSAGVMILGGLIEMAGGRVIFPGKEDPADIRATIDGQDVGIVVVVCDAAEPVNAIMVQEPVGDTRVIGVTRRCHTGAATVMFDINDFTKAPRKSFGGYSILQVERQATGKFKVEGAEDLYARLESVAELVA